MFNKIIHYAIFFIALFLPVSCGLFTDVNMDKDSANGYNVNLSSIVVSDGVLSPNFNESVTSYSVQVQNSVTTLNLSARAADSNSNININGTDFHTYEGLQSITLNVGVNSINVSVIASDGATKKIYNISINRLPTTTKADLSALNVSNGNLSPFFNADTTFYIVYIYNDAISEITVTPTVAEAGATITVNTVAIPSGSASQLITLNPKPAAKNITVKVTAQDNTISKSYILKVYKMASPVLEGYWPLNSSLEDRSINGFDGAWSGTRSVDVPNPEYIAHEGRTGIHFRYTAYEYTETGSGDWIDCEESAFHPKLNIEDYLTVSLWFLWDEDMLNFYNDGTVVPEEGNTYMNIINKSVWFKYGWQIRYDKNSDAIELFLHYDNGSDVRTIVKNFSDHHNKWVHLAVTIDNVNKEIFTYVNGVATDTSPQTFTTSYIPFPDNYESTNWYTGHFSIGAFSHPWGGYSVNGKICDVRLYNGLLDSIQVVNLYNL